MGVMRYLFDNELLQRMDIEDTRDRLDLQRRLDHTSRKRLRENVEGRIDQLENDVGQMALFLRTLFRLLAEKGAVTRAEVLEAARAIDAQDGAADGKYTGRLDAP